MEQLEIHDSWETMERRTVELNRIPDYTLYRSSADTIVFRLYVMRLRIRGSWEGSGELC